MRRRLAIDAERIETVEHRPAFRAQAVDAEIDRRALEHRLHLGEQIHAERPLELGPQPERKFPLDVKRRRFGGWRGDRLPLSLFKLSRTESFAGEEALDFLGRLSLMEEGWDHQGGRLLA